MSDTWETKDKAGTVHLVGAGPGDPELLTLKGARLLERADAVVYDALASPDLLEEVPDHAERYAVGRRAGRAGIPQEAINEILVELAGLHRTVVRLKGGDPFVFGRGGEEALALRGAGVPFHVVPGVSAGVGVPASAGIPLTHREVSSSVTFLTGHRGRDGLEKNTPLSWSDGTVVVFMGLSRLDELATSLIRSGRRPETPAAVVDRGTLPGERTVVGTLRNIGGRVREADLEGPALVVVGDVVLLRDLEGPEASGGLPADSADSPEASPDGAGSRSRARAPWAIFTSAEEVDRALHGGFEGFGGPAGDAPTTGAPSILAAGRGADQRLRRRGLRADLAVRTSHPAAAACALRARADLEGLRVVIPGAGRDQGELGRLLRSLGARVGGEAFPSPTPGEASEAPAGLPVGRAG